MFSNGAGRSYGGGVVHIVSQEPQSNARHPQNPQIFKHEKCEQICFTQKSATTTVEAKSLVPFTAESRNLKSRQTCNRTSAPLDKSTKNVHFCNTCACCCCLSKPTYKVNAVKIIKWHCGAANGIQQLHWGRIKWAPMLWCPSTCSTDDNC